jgi:hypothetical protein
MNWRSSNEKTLVMGAAVFADGGCIYAERLRAAATEAPAEAPVVEQPTAAPAATEARRKPLLLLKLRGPEELVFGLLMVGP